MNSTEFQRYVITGGLLSAAYLAYTCPCPTICSCHLDRFFLYTAVPLGIVIYYNYVL